MLLKYSGTPQYYSFKIRKRNGSFREINAPDKRTKEIQREILRYLEHHTSISEAAYGFVPNRSIFDNAQIHIGQPCVLNIDLKDFFTNITLSRINEVLSDELTSSSGSIGLLKRTIAFWSIYKGRLPQGAPTSPWLSNLVAKRMDIEFIQFAKENGLKYTRYADDLTFSGNTDIIYSLINKIKSIVTAHRFIVNTKKVKVYKNGRCKQVTGIVVDQHLNIQKDKVNRIRAILHNIDKKIRDNIIKDGQTLFEETGFTYEQLQGYVNFIHQANPTKCEKYRKSLDDMKVILLR